MAAICKINSKKITWEMFLAVKEDKGKKNDWYTKQHNSETELSKKSLRNIYYHRLKIIKKYYAVDTDTDAIETKVTMPSFLTFVDIFPVKTACSKNV